jgi:molecular chaperone DnaJ
MDANSPKDYYAILGIDENASADEIKKAFKKLAVQHHPDKKGGNKEKFQEINEAYQVLNDPKKKQQYDMMRKAWFSGGGGFGGQGWFDFSWFSGGGGFGGFDIGDLMGEVFGAGFGGGWSKRARARKGDDISYTLPISFEEAYNGISKTLKIERRVMDDGVSSETCKTCNGSGSIVQQAQTPFGVMQVQNTCPTCNGSGKIFTKDGRPVSNDGLIKKSENLEVNVPAGIKDGVYLKFSNRGNAGLNGWPVGDLYIKIAIKANDYYERKGDDLYVHAQVSIFDLVLWGETTVKHPTGDITVKIPKGTQVTDLIKVSNKGYGDAGIFSSRGHMYMQLQVSIPKKLSKAQEKLRKELQSAK